MQHTAVRACALLAMTALACARRPAIEPARVATAATTPSAPPVPALAAPDAGTSAAPLAAAPTLPVENLAPRWERANLAFDTALDEERLIAHTLDGPRAYRIIDARTGADGTPLPWLATAVQPSPMYGDEVVAALGDGVVTRAGDRVRRDQWRVAFYALATGERRWALPLGDVAEPQVVRVAGAPALFVVRPGLAPPDAPLARVQRLDPATGRPQWSTELPLPDAHVVEQRGDSLLVYASAVHVPRGVQRSTALLALDPQTGERRWRSDFQGAGCEEAAIDGDARSVVVGCPRAVHVLDATTGAERQLLAGPAPAPERARPRTWVALFDDALVVLWGSGALAGYTREAGLPERWRSDELDADELHRLDAGVLVRSRGLELHWVEPSSGRSRWRHQQVRGRFALLSTARAGAPVELLANLSNDTVAFARAPAPAREEPLVVRGTVLVNGAPARDVVVTLGAAETRTDARGRYRIETRVRGRVELGLSLDSLARVAPGRPCVTPRGLSADFTHDGGAAERTHNFAVGVRPYACEHYCDCE